MDVLTKRQQMAAIHDDELLKAKLRKEKIYMVKKENYDAIISKNIPGGCGKFKEIPLTLRIQILDNKTNSPKNTIFWDLFFI